MPMSRTDPAHGRTAAAPAHSVTASAGGSAVPGENVDRGESAVGDADAFGAPAPSHRWLDAMRDLLERAEARITAGFRVPPGGG